MKKSLSQHSQSGLPLSIIPTTPDSIGSPMVKEPLPFTVPSPVQSQLHVSSQHSSEYMLFGQPTTPSSAPISLSFQDPAASIAFPSQEVFQSCFRVNGASSNGLLEALHCDELLRSVNWSEEEKKVKEEVKEEEVKEVKEKEGKEEGKEEEVKEVKEEVKEVKEEEVKEEVKEEKVEKEKEKVMEEEVKTETDMTSDVPKTEEVLIGESDDEMEKTLREKSVDTTVMSAQDLLYDELNRTLQDGLSDEEMAENKTEEVTTQELEALLREDSESVSEEEEVKADSAVNEKGIASEEEKEAPLLSIAFPQEAGMELDPIPIMSPHDAEADSSQPPPIIPSRGSDEDDQPPPILIRTVEPTQLVTPNTSEKSSNVSVRSVDRRGAGNEVPIIASYFNSDVKPEPAKGNAERSFITVEPRASEPLLPAEREEKGAEPVPDAESDANSNTNLAVKPSSDEKEKTRDTLLAEKPDSTQTLPSSTEPATASASTSQSLPHDGMTQLLPSPITPSPNAPLSTQDAALLSSQEKDRIPSQQTIPSSIPLSSSSNPRSQSQDSTVLIPLCLPKEEVAVSAKQSEQSLHEKEMKESASLLEVNYHVHFDDSDEASSQLSQSPPKEESGPVITDLTVLSDSSSEASEDDSISIVEEESLLVPAKNGEESESKDSVAEKEMVEMKEPVEKEEMKKAVSEEEEKVIVEEKPSEEPVVEEEEEKRLEEEKEEIPSMEPVIEREKEMEVVPEEEKEEKEVVAREEGIGETIPSVEPAVEKEDQEQLPEEQTRPPEQQVQPPEEPVQSREEPVQTHKEQTQPPKQPVQAHEVPPQAPEPTEENEQTGKTQEQPSDSEDDLFYSGPRLSQAPSKATIVKPAQPPRLANAPMTPSHPEKRIVPSSQQEVGASPRRTPAAKSYSNAARLSVEAQPSPKRWKRASDQEKTVPRTPQRKTAAKEKSAAAEKRMRKALEALGIEVDVMRRCDV